MSLAFGTHMSYSLNSFKQVIYGIIWGTTIGGIKGHTRSLDYSSYRVYGLNLMLYVPSNGRIL